MEEIVIEYQIKFNKWRYKGQILTIPIPLGAMECDGVDMYLINSGYLDCIANENEYEILKREINQLTPPSE